MHECKFVCFSSEINIRTHYTYFFYGMHNLHILEIHIRLIMKKHKPFTCEFSTKFQRLTLLQQQNFRTKDDLNKFLVLQHPYLNKNFVKCINCLRVVSIYISKHLCVTKPVWMIFKQLTLFFFLICWLSFDLFSFFVCVVYLPTPRKHVI